MTRKMSAAAALIAAAVLLIWSAPQIYAAATTATEPAATTTAKPVALTKAKKPRKANASRASKAAALKAANNAALASKRRKADDTATRETDIPATVANANASMTPPDARGGAAIEGSAPLEAAAADQQDALDRSLAATPVETPSAPMQITANDEIPSPAPAVAAQLDRPVATVGIVGKASASRATDPWAQSSLVGKLFIALGSVLTLASAARMLVA